MAGTLNVDTLKADSNLKLQIATANVAFIDSNGLNIVGGNLTLSGTTFATGGQIQNAAIATGAITGDKLGTNSVSSNNIVSVNASTLSVGTIPVARMPSGSIIQTPAQAITYTQISFTTTIWTDWSGMSVSITPSSTSSKILVVATINGLYSNLANQNPLIRLLRNSTDIAHSSDYAPFGTASGAYGGSQGGIFFIDSPATTSSVTYKLQYKSDAGGLVYVNVNDSSGAQLGDASTNSFLTVFEIAG